MQMPTLSDLTSGKAKFDQIKPISIEDLLEREAILVILKIQKLILKIK